MRALCRAAEDGDKADRCRKPGGQTQQRAKNAAEGGPHKEAGHDFAALEPAGKGQRGEEDLAQKVPRQGLALLHGGGDDVHARTVVPAHAEQVGKGDDGHAAHEDAQPRVREELRHLVLHEVQQTAEQPGDGGAREPQQDDEEGVPDRQLRGRDGKVGGGDAKGQRAAVSDEGAEVKAGTKAEVKVRPTSSTIMAKRAAVRGCRTGRRKRRPCR